MGWLALTALVTLTGCENPTLGIGTTITSATSCRRTCCRIQ